jgi:hypothetical protein
LTIVKGWKVERFKVGRLKVGRLKGLNLLALPTCNPGATFLE